MYAMSYVDYEPHSVLSSRAKNNLVPFTLEGYVERVCK
jgi:hypothetical protein